MNKLKIFLLVTLIAALSFLGYKNKTVFKVINDFAVVNDNNKYKIGAVLPLTGQIGYIGEQELVGLKLSVEDINTRKETNGFGFKLIYEDSASQAANAVTAARKLIDIDKVDALFVSTTSATRAIAPIAQAANIPLLAMSSDPEITSASPVVFRVFMNSGVEQELLAERLSILHMKNVFVLYNQDRAFEAAYQELKGLLESKGIKDVAAETFEKTQTDFRSVIQKAKNSKVEAYVFIGFGAEFPHILTQWGDKGKVRYFGNYTFGTAGAQSQGIPLIEGIEFPTFSIRNDSPKLVDFKKRALDIRDGKPLSDFMDHLYSYESLLFIEQCSRIQHAEQTKSLLAACDKVKTFQGLSDNITIDQNRNANVPMSLGVYRNGILQNAD